MGSSSRGSGSWRFWRVNNWGTWTLGTPKSVPLLFDGHISQIWRQTLCPNMSKYEYVSENFPKDLSVDQKICQSNQNQQTHIMVRRLKVYLCSQWYPMVTKQLLPSIEISPEWCPQHQYAIWAQTYPIQQRILDRNQSGRSRNDRGRFLATSGSGSQCLNTIPPNQLLDNSRT